MSSLLAGLPRGCISEIVGQRSGRGSGQRSAGCAAVLHSILAESIARGEICALVDGANCFDTFERWGIRTLAALAELPEIGLAERFGEEGIRLHRLTAPGVRGTVLTASGPWRSSGEWWTGTRWARDEWDIDSSDGGVYRIYLRLNSGDWFVEGVYD